MTEDEMVGWHHSVDISLGELQELVMDREPGGSQAGGSQRVRHDGATYTFTFTLLTEREFDVSGQPSSHFYWGET